MFRKMLAKRTISLLLVFMLAISALVPAAAFAEETGSGEPGVVVDSGETPAGEDTPAADPDAVTDPESGDPDSSADPGDTVTDPSVDPDGVPAEQT
ncbi:hypothetical protein K0U00_31025, partial [Paenibacillus sepulcri]|nr:hypothetical protein [Paenibacillus sepulcri]